MATATTMVALTMIAPRALGSRCRKIIRRSFAPNARAASTYSFSRSERNTPRTTREIGAQKSVQIALLVALLSTTIGTLVGAVAGFYRGRTDALLMRFVDLVLTVPSLAILAVLASVVGSKAGGWFFVAIVLA